MRKELKMLFGKTADSPMRRTAFLRYFVALPLILSASALTGCYSGGLPHGDNEKFEAIAEPEKQLLSGTWYMVRSDDAAGADAKKASDSDFAMNDYWFRATVPGTVLTSYYRAGIIDDPYYSDNMDKLDQDYYNTDYLYRTVFTMSDPGNRRVVLHFDGINYKADIFLNGHELGTVEGAFRHGEFDITDYLRRDGGNCLALYIHYNESHTNADSPTFICSAGWDWMPPIPGRNMGIYKDVWISYTDDISLSSPHVVTGLKENDAEIRSEVTLTNHSKIETSGTLRVRAVSDDLSSGFSYEIPVTLAAGENRTVSDTRILKDPKLWWPNGYGEQPIYSIEYSFTVNGVVSDSVYDTFGIRELSYGKDVNGKLILSVNGKKILCRGGNWGMTDALLGWDEKDFDRAVKMHADMNFNMIRNWMGMSDFEEFYDACDKYGILVFADFWLNGSDAPSAPGVFLDNASDRLLAYRNHPSIALWCGANEGIPDSSVNSPLRNLVSSLDGTRKYIAASDQGDVSRGIGYSLKDPTWYFDNLDYGFLTELGTPTVPTAASMIRMLGDDVWPVGNRFWDYHDYGIGWGNRATGNYTNAVSNRYGKAVDIYDFCEKAQLVNFETYRAMFEACNTKMWNGTSGLLLWMSNAAWPSTLWQLYDSYGAQTGGYYGAKLSCEPVHIQWNVKNGEIGVVNISGKMLEDAVAEWQVLDIFGKELFKDQSRISAADNCYTAISSLFADNASDLAAGVRAEATSEDSGYEAGNVTDGKPGTRWTAKSSGRQSVTLDLGSVKTVGRVKITWETAYAQSYTVSLSADGEDWHDVYSESDGDGGDDTVTFTPENARYLRVTCLRPATMWTYSIYNICVYESANNSGITGLTDTHFIRLKLKDKDGNLLSENFYWRSLRDTDYSALDSMDEAAVSASLTSDGKGNLTLTVKNTSSVPAVAISLSAIMDGYKGKGDNRILPADYSDNYFTLFSGEEKTVSITFDPENAKGYDAAVIVKAFNGSPVTVKR